MFLSAYLGDGTVDINSPRFCIGDLQHYFYQVVSPKPLEELTLTEQMFLRPAALMHLMTAVTQEPVFVKTHNANILADSIPLIQTEYTARAVYIIRDPRDVAVSYSKHFQVSIPKAIKAMGAEKNAVGTDLYHVVSSWSQNVKTWTQEKDFPVGVIKYEDLSKNPLEKFRGILKFLEIEPDEERLAASVQSVQFERLRDQEAEDGFRENPSKIEFFRSGKPGAWRDVLTDKQEQRIRRDHGEVMGRFGY